MQIFDQHTALLQAVKHVRCPHHLKQQKIRFRGIDGYTGDFNQALIQRDAIPFDLRRLSQQHLVMFQQFCGHELRQNADIIRQTQLVQLCQPGMAARQKTAAQPRHAQLGKGAHHQQIGVIRQMRHEAVRGKRIISLVHHHQTLRGTDNLPHRLRVEAVASRVVRISQEHQRRLFSLNGGQRGRQIQRVILRQRHAHIAHPDKGCDHLVHDKRRLDRKQGSTRLVHRQRQQLDQLVRTVAQQHAHAFRQIEQVTDFFLECGGIGVGIQIDRRIGNHAGNLVAQKLRQRIRVFHRVQLDKPAAIRHMIGGKRENFGTNQRIDQRKNRRHNDKHELKQVRKITTGHSMRGLCLSFELRILYIPHNGI